MKLDDVLAMAGDHQLSSFDWGASAVILVNTLLSPENHIDVSHTGKESFEKLRRLPSAILFSVLTREVQVVGAFVDFVGTARDQASIVPITVPQSQRRMSPMAIFLMIIMSAISIALTFSSMQQAQKTGQMPDTQTLQVILQTMGELVKDTNRPADTPENP